MVLIRWVLRHLRLPLYHVMKVKYREAEVAGRGDLMPRLSRLLTLYEEGTCGSKRSSIWQGI